MTGLQFSTNHINRLIEESAVKMVKNGFFDFFLSFFLINKFAGAKGLGHILVHRIS